MVKKFKLINVLLAFSLVISMVASFNSGGVIQKAKAANWTLVWSDEFNGSSLDTSKWTAEIGTGTDGWGNNELQYYTSRSENLSVSGGNLIITARNESYGGRNYTSARIKTQNKYSFTYGKVEARIKLPTGQGLWPAFWMLGSNIDSQIWPKCGEIDIMEHINNNTYVTGAVHWDANGQADYDGVSGYLDFSQYHVYSIEWDSSYIRWYVDGTLFNQFYIQNNTGNTEEFHKPFFILLNLAVGGNWPGSPNSSTPFPSQMLVDYVRVYQDSASSGIVSGGVYTLTAKCSGKVLDVVNSSVDDGAKMIQKTYNGGNSQKFRVDNMGGYYKITNINSAKCLDVPYGQPTAGLQLQQVFDNGNDAQRWQIISTGNGYYKVVSKATGLVMDVSNSSTADGAVVWQWTDNGTDAQRWYFTRVQ